MKKKGRISKVIYLGIFVTISVIILAGMNMRTIINNDGVMVVAKKAGANDATIGEVLENYTFTSDKAGIGVMGSISDYSKTLMVLKLKAADANKTVTFDVPDGYYTQVNIDATDVYNAGADLALVGTAGKGDVLAGKTFTNSTTIGATGTMPNNGAITASLNPGGSYTIPAGYHNGSGKITVNKKAATFKATTRSASLNMGETNTYRYLDTTGIPNSKSETFKPTTSGLLDMKADNNYRYVDMSGVYKAGASAQINNVWLRYTRFYGETYLPLDYSKIKISSPNNAKVYIYDRVGTLLDTVYPPSSGRVYRTIQ